MLDVTAIRSQVLAAYPGLAVRQADGTFAVEELSIQIPAGQLVAFVGPSGCGKTTTLKMINRLIEPTSGRILLGEDDVTRVNPVELRRRIGYVIQNVGLFPHQTVEANVATVPRLLGWDKKRQHTRALELLELVGLDPKTFATRYPAQLSGGQRQRVGVARALGADPPVLLMDEPFSAIDPIARGRLQDEFLRVQREVRKTIVFVTHDLDEAVRLADRIAIFRQGGILEQFGTPAELLGSPATEFVADFVGGQRGLRRLSVTPIERGDLETTDGVSSLDEAAEVPIGGTLQDAMAALLTSDLDYVRVVDASGRVLGVLTSSGVHQALRRSVRAGEPAKPAEVLD
jgi:osmoprotectant transport system ATP-binding protein